VGVGDIARIVPSIAIVLDGADLEQLGAFWSAVLDYPSQRPVTQFLVLSPETPDDARPQLILQRVPEGKVVKNRMHLDLHVPDIAAARDHYLSLGATLLQEAPNCIGEYCWYLMADPEGNEFCVAMGG
jgi:predicted enzyme related to lactoylglutathione lyase